MAKRKSNEEDLATPQQKAKPVPPPEDGARPITSPMTFFNDPRMAASPGGVRDFAPKAVREDAAGNGESTSEGDAG